MVPELRDQLWPQLLGVFQWDSTQQERNAELERLRRWMDKQAGRHFTAGSMLHLLWEAGSADVSRP